MDARVKLVFSVFFAACLLSACSLKGIALRSTTALLDQGAAAYEEEPDTQLGKEAIASQLKLLEALLRNAPNNKRLLLLAAQGFCGYAFLYLEDFQPERAKAFYLRGRDHALRALAADKSLSALAEKPLEEMEAALNASGRARVPALFWAAFGWSNAINLSRDSVSAIADLPKAVAIMQRVHSLDKEFHFAGPDLFFGAYFASRPAMLGGDNAKAKLHFEWARRLTAGKYLMAYVLEARYYAVAVQDKELFESLLKRVLEAPAGALPNARLTDEVAKEKAKKLLENADEYF
jgi:hypothetical protein